MREKGIFEYKTNLYQYCERFMIAFSDPNYGEMVLHPPPLSYASAFIILFLPIPPVMKYICKGFSYLMYWFENFVFIFLFILVELLLLPVAYLRIWYNIIRMSMGCCMTLLNCLLWAVIGIPVILFLYSRDICYFICMLTYHQGCRYGHEEIAPIEFDTPFKIKIYNECRATVISLFNRLRTYMSKDNNKGF